VKPYLGNPPSTLRRRHELRGVPIGSRRKDGRVTAIAQGPTAALAPNDPIDRLLETFHREHALALQAVSSALQHAFLAGAALLEMQPLVQGPFKEWAQSTLGIAYSTANDYMRLAHFRSELEEAGVKDIKEAVTLLTGRARRESGPGRNGLSPTLIAEARRLHRAGVSQRVICERLGVAKSTVYWWTHPEKHREHLRRLQATKADAARARADREARQIAQAVRKNGAGLAELYAMAERMQDVIAQAHREEGDRDARRHLGLAGQHYRRMRDEVVAALATHAEADERTAA
jgi:transposase